MDRETELREAAPVLIAARQAERAGDMVRAVEILRGAHEANPANPMFAVRLGSRLRGLGRYHEALAVLRAAAQRAPQHRDVAIELARTLQQDERVDEAERIERALLLRFPGDAEVEVAWVLAKTLLGEPEAVLDRARTLVATARSRFVNATVLARVLVGMGRHREASSRLRELLASDPRVYSAWVVLGLALRGLGDLPGFAEVTERAAALNPGAAWTAWLKGEGARLADEPGEAEFWFGEALSVHARFQPAMLGMARALQARGAMDLARERYREATATAPWDGEARGRWLLFRAATGETELGLDRAEAEALRHPHKGLLVPLAELHLHVRKQPSVALGLARRAVETAPDDVWAKRLLADLSG